MIKNKKSVFVPSEKNGAATSVAANADDSDSSNSAATPNETKEILTPISRQFPIYPQNEQYYGLVISVREFKCGLQLPECISHGADELRDVLVSKSFGGMLKHQCRRVIDPTMVDLESAFEDIVDESNTDSVFFLYFVTHGIEILQGEHQGSYFLLKNSELSSEDELAASSLNVPSKHKVVIIDACHHQDILSTCSHKLPRARGCLSPNFQTDLHDILSVLIQNSADTQAQALKDLKAVMEDENVYKPAPRKRGGSTSPSSKQSTFENKDGKTLDSKRKSKLLSVKGNVEPNKQEFETKRQTRVSLFQQAEEKQKLQAALKERASVNAAEARKATIARKDMIISDPTNMHVHIISACSIKDNEVSITSGGSNAFLEHLVSGMRGSASDAWKITDMYRRQRERFKKGDNPFGDLSSIYISSTGLLQYLKARLGPDNEKKLRPQTPTAVGVVGRLDIPVSKAPRIPPTPAPPKVLKRSRHFIDIEWAISPAGATSQFPDAVTGISIYEVQWSCTSSKEDWKTLGLIQAVYNKKMWRSLDTVTRYRCNGLLSDAEYRFRVRARNGGGWGYFSAPCAPVKTISPAENLHKCDPALTSSEEPMQLANALIQTRHDRQMQRCLLTKIATLAFRGQASQFASSTVASEVLASMRTYSLDPVVNKEGCRILLLLAPHNLKSKKGVEVNNHALKQASNIVDQFPAALFPSLWTEARAVIHKLSAMKKK